MGQELEPIPSTVIKTYPPRGPLQQFRLGERTAFRCFRCGDTKKSKLITVYSKDWSRRLCNGCYGRLLSLYEIKIGTAADDERVDRLLAALVSAVAEYDRRQAERLFRISEARAEQLSEEAVRFVATAEHVAGRLEAHPQLEWSPAVIGLCKAAEVELIRCVVRPLANCVALEDLSADENDKDIGRVAAFCRIPTRKPPELGAFAHFLQTVSHSQRRRETSVLLRGFLKLSREWTDSNWVLEPRGLFAALTLLTKIRNRAAHMEELGNSDYLSCRTLVIGDEGLLWKLLVATQHHK
jgi:hypothetical protein